MGERFDVVIVGSGAGGGTLALRLAPSGKRALLVERGGFLPRERENWDPAEVIGKARYRARIRYLDAAGEPFEPFAHHWVGGATKMYGAALLRLRESDFGAVRHHDGISPAWPLGYADFEPYYTEAERIYSVHGQRREDPCEPFASAPFPHPPLPHEPRIARLAEDFRANGLRPFPLPLGVRLPDGRGSSPVTLSLFDGFPDPTGTKADAQVCAVEPALRHDNVTLMKDALAERLVTDASGREVVALEVRRRLPDGSEATERIEGDVFVVACGAIESAALLLRSRSDAHPNGLGNRNGLVGRGYMAHQNGALLWVSRRTRNDSQLQKTLAMTDWYLRGPGSELPCGIVQLMGRSDPSDLRPLMPGVTDAGRSVEDVAAHTVDFWLTAEDLPDDDNRVSITRDGRVQVTYRRNNAEAYRRLRAALVEVLSRIEPDSQFLGYELGVGGVSHQNGTLRFGHDPDASVLDPFCRSHEVHNLYACDASFFPSCGAVNPSLTIMANALRVGDHLVERLG